jgi:hypothetical protein
MLVKPRLWRHVDSWFNSVRTTSQLIAPAEALLAAAAFRPIERFPSNNSSPGIF